MSGDYLLPLIAGHLTLVRKWGSVRNRGTAAPSMPARQASSRAPPIQQTTLPCMPPLLCMLSAPAPSFQGLLACVPRSLHFLTFEVVTEHVRPTHSTTCPASPSCSTSGKRFGGKETVWASS